MNRPSHIQSLIESYLALQGVGVAFSDIDKCWVSAPSFPSMDAISQTLAYFGVTNQVQRMDLDAFRRSMRTAIVYVKAEEGKYVIVYYVDDRIVRYYDPSKLAPVELSRDVFESCWDGVVLTAVEGAWFASTFRSVNDARRRKLFWSMGLTLCILLTGLIASATIDHRNLYFLSGFTVVLSGLGLFLSTLLMVHEFHLPNSTVVEVCNASRSFDCDKVLGSKYSKFFAVVSFMDMGFLYFAFGLMLVLLGWVGAELENCLELLCVLAYGCLPFIVFSLLYQKLVVRKWCPFCLCVIGVITATCVLSFPMLAQTGQFRFLTWTVLSLTSIAFLVALLVLLLSRNLLRLLAGKYRHNVAMLRFKRDPRTYRSYFVDKHQAPLSDYASVTLGDGSLPVTMTVVVNLLCEPCKSLIYSVIDLRSRYPDAVYWRIMFDGSPQGNTKENQLQLFLLQAYKDRSNDDDFLVTLTDWLRCMSFEEFVADHSLKNHIENSTRELFHKQVVANLSVHMDHLPYLLVNDTLFPAEYELSDLIYLVRDPQFVAWIAK